MLALQMDNTAATVDLVRDGGNFVEDQGLETAVVISLFTDARADDSDDVADGDLRGFWGDGVSDGKFPHGSRLWTLRRAKTTQDTLNRAKAYSEEALQWLIDDRIAESVEATAERLSSDILLLTIKITKLDGSVFERRWEMQLDV